MAASTSSPSTTAPTATNPTRLAGTVKWYNHKAGYGFLRQKICSKTKTNSDYFVHRNHIQSSSSSILPSLRNGEEVEFEVTRCARGWEATKVTGPRGKPVLGSPHALKKKGENLKGEQGTDLVTLCARAAIAFADAGLGRLSNLFPEFLVANGLPALGVPARFKQKPTITTPPQPTSKSWPRELIPTQALRPRRAPQAPPKRL
ncbi:MAG: cold shock domain-containing protein, partial [Candidatus Brocadiaceae bacterium]|nr:cold shock domain-containing protein [Candidatus Brocadiaceae bacterium]